MGGSVDIASLLPPTPEQQPVKVQPAAPPTPDYGIGAGWMGKGGQIASIAAPLLEGWIQGKQVAEERKQKKAQDQLSGARNLFAMSVQAYRSWQENNPDAKPEEKQAKLQAVQQARDAYAGVMSQYVEPATKQKGVKAGLKKAFTAPTPELFAQNAVKAFQGIPVDELVAPDALRKIQMEREQAGIGAEKASTKASEATTAREQEQLKGLKQRQKDTDEWASLRANQHRTPEQEQRFRELSESLGKNQEQMARDDVMHKLLSGQKLTPGEETFARAEKLLQDDQSGMLQDSTGAWYMVKVSPDGKVQKTPLGIKGQLPKIQTPGYYESIRDLAKAYREADPSMNQQDAMKRAIAAFAQAPDPGNLTGTKFATTLDGALRDVWNAHKNDPDGQASVGNFIEKEGNLYQLRTGDIAQTGKTSWWSGHKPLYQGLTADQVQEKENKIKGEVAQALLTKGMQPAQIDAVMQGWNPQIPGGEGKPGLEPPPAGGAAAAGGGGPQTKNYTITGPDGKSVRKSMTADQVAAFQAKFPNVRVSAEQ